MLLKGHLAKFVSKRCNVCSPFENCMQNHLVAKELNFPETRILSEVSKFGYKSCLSFKAQHYWR